MKENIENYVKEVLETTDKTDPESIKAVTWLLKAYVSDVADFL